MVAYLIRRVFIGLFTIWAISILAFVIIQIPPGDWLDEYEAFRIGTGAGQLTPAERELLRDYFGLDQPMYVRYGKWAWKLLHGDAGFSYLSDFATYTPVMDLIGNRLQMTVILSGFTIMVTWVFAIPIGIYSAMRHHSVGDYVFTFLGFTGLATPDFLLGLVLMYIALAYFGQDVGGLFSDQYLSAAWGWPRIWDILKHLWIPAIVLGTSGTASLIRVMRNNLLDELGKPYVTTALAKGMAPWRVVLKYPVRVALNPLISSIGYLLPSLFSGSIIVSVVLSLPTVGPLLLTSIRQQDTFMAGFIILMLGVLTVIGTLLSDIALAIADPRIRLANQ